MFVTNQSHDPRKQLQDMFDCLPDDFPDELLDELGEHKDRMLEVLCRFYGHAPQPDMCNNPAHDFCSWCIASTPGEYKRAPVVQSETPASKAGDAGVTTQLGAPLNAEEK